MRVPTDYKSAIAGFGWRRLTLEQPRRFRMGAETAPIADGSDLEGVRKIKPFADAVNRKLAWILRLYVSAVRKDMQKCVREDDRNHLN